MDEDAAGNIWIGSNSGGFVKRDSAGFHHYFYTEKENFSTSLIKAFGNELFIGHYENGFLKLIDGKFYKFHYTRERNESLYFMLKANGTYWISDYRNGVFSMKDGKLHRFTVEDGISSNCYSLLADSNDNIWITTLHSGINRIDNQRFSLNNQETEIPVDLSEEIKYDHHGDLWFFPNGSNLVQQTKDKLVLYRDTITGLAHVWDGEFTSTNDVWLGTYSRGICLLANGKFTYYRHQGTNVVLDMELVGDTLLYAMSQDQGLLKYNLRHFEVLNLKNGLTGKPTGNFFRATNGRLFIAIVNDGVNILKNDSVARLNTANGLLSNSVTSITEDSGGRIWIATSAGVTLIENGKIFGISPENGLQAGAVSSVLQYSDSIFWLAGSSGLAKIELLGDEQFRICNYDQNYSPNLNSFNTVACKTEINDIYWSNNEGLVKFNAQFEVCSVPAPIFAGHNVLFNDTLNLSPGDTLEVAPNGLLKIDFAAIYWGYEKNLRYRYALSPKGQQSRWVELGNKNNLYLSNLKHGAYTLLLQAIGTNTDSNVLTFSLNFLPHWYETTAFKLAVIVLLLSIVSFLFYIRIKAHRINEQKLTALVVEKTEQLAQEKTLLEVKNAEIKEQNRYKEVLIHEIHHRVKNNLQIMSSIIDIQARATPDPVFRNEVKSIKARINAMALMHEMLYKSEDLSKIKVHNYLTAFIQNIIYLYSEKSVDFDTNIDDAEISIDKTISLCLIISEAISNSVKYAFQNTAHPLIKIEFKKTQPHGAQLTISDNGCGFNFNEIKQTKNLGLKIIRSVSGQLGGRPRFETQNGVKINIHFNKIQL